MADNFNLIAHLEAAVDRARNHHAAKSYLCTAAAVERDDPDLERLALQEAEGRRLVAAHALNEAITALRVARDLVDAAREGRRALATKPADQINSYRAVRDLHAALFSAGEKP